MRLHGRLLAIALLAAAGLAAAGCPTLSGSGGSAPELVQLRDQLRTSRAGLEQAAQGGDLSRAGSLLGEIRSGIDAAESRSSAMNLLDRQHLALQVATGRRALTEADRWVQAGDADAVREEVRQIGIVLTEIDVLLERTIRAAAAEAPGGA